MANLGTLTLDLIAKTGSFIGPLDKAGRQAKKTSKDVNDSFSDSLKSVTKWGLGLGVVATGAVVAFAKKSIDAASAINDVAKAASVSTDTLQEMRHAASLSGISFDELDGSLQRFNKSIGEARAGSGSLYSYLKKVDQGLLDQVRSANSTDDALNLIFKAMKNVSNESERAALASAAFGRSGTKLSVLADDYETLRKEAQSLGLVIDSQLIKNADEAGDKLETLSRVIGTQLTSALLEAAPAIQAVAQGLIDIAPGLSWLLGGDKRSSKRVEELNAVGKEIQDLIKLQNEWKGVEQTQLALKAQKGSLFNLDTLKEAQNNIETIRETVRGLNSKPDTGKKTTPPRSLENVQDTSWGDLGKVVEATSETNKQRLEIIRASNLAIKAENDRQLSKDIARDAAYHQLVDEANIAELNNITDNVERELALHEYKYEKLKELYEEGSAELIQIERIEKAEREAINDDYWENYISSLEVSMASMDSIVGNSIDSLSSEFGNFFASAIMDSENLGESFKSMLMGMASSTLAAIGKMIAQWIVYKVAKIAADKTVQASAIPQMVGSAEAGALLAGINAYASAAAIPYVGWSMAPAAMAAAQAVTQPMVAGVATAMISGLAHDGIDSVPETGTWLLKKGERVTTERTSKRLDNTLSRINGNGYSEAVSRTKKSNLTSGESHYHYHSHGPVFLDRAQMRDAAKMLMKESDRERTRIGAVN